MNNSATVRPVSPLERVNLEWKDTLKEFFSTLEQLEDTALQIYSKGPVRRVWTVNEEQMGYEQSMEPMDCGRTTFQRYATVFSIQPSLASDTFKVKWFAVAGFALDTEDMIGEWKDDVTISFRQHRLQDLQKSLEIIKNTLDDLEDNYVKFAME